MQSRRERRRQRKQASGKAKDCKTVEKNNAKIKAYSQQSRFHTDAIEKDTKSLNLKGVCVSIGERDLLNDTDLVIEPGLRYGLLGRNGVGKSTLLKVLSQNLMEGIPDFMKFLYIDQLEAINSSDKTALQCV